MDRATVNRGVPLERGAALPDPRSGSDLRQHCHTPNACHGHPGQAHRARLALAEWLCRTVDRIDPARVCGSFYRLGRGASAPHPANLRSLLQSTSERIGHWIKMRRSIARFSGSDLSIRTRSWADFTITTFAFRFLVHTGNRSVLVW